MQFIHEAFGSNIQITREPKRKFAAKEYIGEINRYSKLTDLRNENLLDLESATKRYGIIDVQLLDFAGSLYLNNKNWTISSGFNKLFTKNVVDNESLLLEHKLKLVRYMRNFEHEGALTELEQIQKFGEAERSKIAKFKYACVKGRILMRARKLQQAKLEFENAFVILENKFSEEEQVSLIVNRKDRLKGETTVANWDTVLVDYDSLFLRYLYSLVLSWTNEAEVIPNLIVELEKAVTLAQSYELVSDEFDIHHLFGDVYIKLNDSHMARKHFEKALKLFENRDLDNTSIILYGNVAHLLIEIHGNQNNFLEIDRIIRILNIRADEENIYWNFVSYRAEVTYSNFQRELERSFSLSKDYIDTYLNKSLDLSNISKILIVREIYELVVKGIELNYFKSKSDVSKYIDYTHNLKSLLSVTKTFEELIYLRFDVKNVLQDSENFNEINRIETSYENLLVRTKHDPMRFNQVVLAYYECIILLEKTESKIKAKSLVLANNIAQDLNSTPFVRMIIKNEIVIQVLTSKTTELRNKLIQINEKYNISELDDLLTIIDEYEKGEIDFQEFLSLLFLDDVKYSKIDRTLLIPIELIVQFN